MIFTTIRQREREQKIKTEQEEQEQEPYTIHKQQQEY